MLHKPNPKSENRLDTSRRTLDTPLLFQDGRRGIFRYGSESFYVYAADLIPILNCYLSCVFHMVSRAYYMSYSFICS